MKSLPRLLLLAAPALLLAACDQKSASSSPSVSPSESEIPSEITTPSQTESEPVSDSGDSSDSSSSSPVVIGELTLDSFLSAVKSGNYTVVYDDSYMYADDALDYYSYYLDEGTVVYLTDYGDGSTEGSVVGNNDDYGLVQVDFADGQVYGESLVSPAQGVKIVEGYYTPADFLGEPTDWTAEGSSFVNDSDESKESLLHFLGLDEYMEAADLGDLSLTLGEDAASLETTIDGEAFAMTFSDFGTTVYDGVEDMLAGVEFSVPTDWGIAATYADEFGIAFRPITSAMALPSPSMTTMARSRSAIRRPMLRSSIRLWSACLPTPASLSMITIAIRPAITIPITMATTASISIGMRPRNITRPSIPMGMSISFSIL